MELLAPLGISLISGLPHWLEAGLSIVGAASAVAALTPTPKDDRWVGRAYRLLDWLALNVGHAKEVPPNRSR